MFNIKNLSSPDRVIRLIFAIVATILYFTGILHGTRGFLIFLFGIILAITSFINYCPIYHSLGISTRKKKKIEES